MLGLLWSRQPRKKDGPNADEDAMAAAEAQYLALLLKKIPILQLLLATCTYFALSMLFGMKDILDTKVRLRAEPRQGCCSPLVPTLDGPSCPSPRARVSEPCVHAHMHVPTHMRPRRSPSSTSSIWAMSTWPCTSHRSPGSAS